MLHVVLIAALAAAPDAPAGTATAAKEEPVKLASPGFNAVNVDEKLAGFFADHFAQQLTLQGLRVLTASEISALVGFERQKQLMGCSENSQSCMAELANALGVDGLIIGSIAKFDTTYQVNLKVVASADAAPLAAFSAQAEGDKAMLAKLNEAARAIAPQVLKKLGRKAVTPEVGAGSLVAEPTPTVTAEEPAAAGKKWPLAPTIAGGVLLAGGGFFTAIALDERSQIFDTNGDLVNARNRAGDLQWKGFAATGCYVAGVAALVTAGVMYATSGSPPPASVSLSAGPGGAGVVVSGVLP